MPANVPFIQFLNTPAARVVRTIFPIVNSRHVAVVVEYPFGIDFITIVSAVWLADQADQFRIRHLECAQIMGAIRTLAILGVDLGALGADYWVPDSVDSVACTMIVVRPLAVFIGVGFV